MNATSRTLTFLVVALVSAAAAVSTWFGSRPAVIEGFADVGQAFSPKFEDPLTATSLTVVEFNDKAKEAQSFSVRQTDNGNWVIPSHHDYPAEARDRLARTAASLIGIKKTAVQSRAKDDWKNYGVVDPAAEGAATKEERGTRISLRDASGNPLVDLIVGKKVEGREKHYYVREPEKNTTYVAEMQVDLSAKFADWIEPDLLKVAQNDIVRVVVDNYSVNEEEGAIVPGETLKFAFEKENSAATGKWLLEGLDDAAEKLDENAVRDITRNLDQLKIVGVRPKPKGLNADLTMSPEVAENPLLRQVLQSDMQRQGFFAARTSEGTRLVSNEGELLAGASNGVRYTLYFGEIARGSEKDIEVGFAGDAAKEEAKPADAATAADADRKDEKKLVEPDFDKEKEEGGPRRYLLVKVDFDETLLGPAPVEPVAPVKPAILEEAAASAADSAQSAAPAAAPASPEPAKEEPASPEPAKEEPAAPEPATSAPEEKSSSTDAVKPEDSDEEIACAVEEDQDQDLASTTAAATEDDVKPAETAPVTEPAAAETPAAETPADSAPAADAPAAETPAAPAATTEAPAATTPPVTETPATTTPAAETPAATPPATETPATTTPATTTPAADAPAATTPPEPVKDPKVVAEEAYKAAMGEYEAQKRAYDADVKARTEKLAEGKKAAEELSERFSSWYYVISADSFEKFRVQRKTVVSAKTEEDKKQPAGAVPGGGLPGGGFPGGFPGGIPGLPPQQ
jgi:hypothetical protein